MDTVQGKSDTPRIPLSCSVHSVVHLAFNIAVIVEEKKNWGIAD